jgi:thiol:disulfide interchange protein DsbD
MLVVKQALAFPMYGAAVWLIWVISQEAGPYGVLATALGMLLLGLGAWAFGLAEHARGHGRRLAHVVAAAAVLATAAIVPGLSGASAPAATATAGAEPFTSARLAALQADGRPVFVDMTAAWCVTCLVNEQVALAPASVRQAFQDRRVAYLKGDWTRQDPEITAFLRSHGRDGVPLYVYYPGRGAPPAVLPQILTQAIVLDALARTPG